MECLSIIIFAPGGVEVTSNLPGAGGLWDDKNPGNKRRKYKIVSDAGSIRRAFMLVHLGPISPYKVCEEKDT